MRHKGFMGKCSNRLYLICGTIFCSLAVETKTSESNDVKYPGLLEMNHYQKSSSFERTRKINRFEKKRVPGCGLAINNTGELKQKEEKTKKAQENKTEQTNAFIDPGIIGIIERTNVLT